MTDLNYYFIWISLEKFYRYQKKIMNRKPKKETFRSWIKSTFSIN